MCGIVGYVGQRSAIEVLLKGLKRLEYRGYDSTGVAYFEKNQIKIQKSEGKLSHVENFFKNHPTPIAHCGIGHTRWATHGKPTTQNAHPHRAGHVVLVHNGIIENYPRIKSELVAKGHRPISETDSELFGFLVLDEMNDGHRLVEAVRRAFLKLEGSGGVVVMSEREPGLIVGVRNGSPLVAAIDPQGGVMIGSDAQPLLEYTKEVYFLENEDVVVAQADGLQFFELKSGNPVTRLPQTLDWTPERLDKQGFPHYMLKEIHEQPVALVDTLNSILDRAQSDSFSLASQPGADLLRQAQALTLVACGTSWHAALLAKYWLEQFAQIPVNVELASEFRYRTPVLKSGHLVVGLSQSGETADTLAVIRDLKKKGIKTLGLTNVRGSTLQREADACFLTAAGPEIGVAATKTFLAQLMSVLLWAGTLAPKTPTRDALFTEILKLPHHLKSELESESGLTQSCQSAAKKFLNAKGFFFIGRGYSFPIALEGALKLKEIAYVHSEGYAAGELKHGPIAMIDDQMVVVVLVPRDHWREKTISSLEEVKARGAKILSIGSALDDGLANLSDHMIQIPDLSGVLEPVREALMPFFLAPVIQLLSYELAVLKGTDVDQPRNLAKSVTVE